MQEVCFHLGTVLRDKTAPGISGKSLKLLSVYLCFWMSGNSHMLFKHNIWNQKSYSNRIQTVTVLFNWMSTAVLNNLAEWRFTNPTDALSHLFMKQRWHQQLNKRTTTSKWQLNDKKELPFIIIILRSSFNEAWHDSIRYHANKNTAAGTVILYRVFPKLFSPAVYGRGIPSFIWSLRSKVSPE